MTTTLRPIRTLYLLLSLGIGLTVAYFQHPYAAVVTTFLLVQFDLTLRK